MMIQLLEILGELVSESRSSPMSEQNDSFKQSGLIYPYQQSNNHYLHINFINDDGLYIIVELLLLLLLHLSVYRTLVYIGLIR